MKRQIKLFLVMVVMMAMVVSCASDTPWRKATVTTFELVGVGVGATRDTAEALKAQNLITDEQLGKIKVAYNKARNVYEAAGKALKLAGKAVSASERDVLLTEYDKLLTEFGTLAYQVYDLIKGFKKVSYYEVQEAMMTGGSI